MRYLSALCILAVCGCSTIQGKPLLPYEQPAAKAKPSAAVFTFEVTFLQKTTLEGIPFVVDCRKNDGKQGFLLGCQTTHDYQAVACGYIDEDNIVWTNWLLQKPTFGPKQTVKFVLYPIGRDQIGITSVSLLGDGLFTFDGDTPKNPPEE